MYRPLSILLATAVLSIAACDQRPPPTLSLYRAVHAGDLDQVMRHLDAGTDINQPDVNGDYPLHVAARQGQVNIARALVENGALPEVLDAAGQSPMRVALGGGKTQVAQMLIEQGALLDPQGMLGELVGAGVSDRDSFKLLLRRGASLDRADARGDAPLHLAILAGHLDAVARLIELGADVNRPNAAGQTPLGLALGQAPRRDGADRAILKLLQRNGAAPGKDSPVSTDAVSPHDAGRDIE